METETTVERYERLRHQIWRRLGNNEKVPPDKLAEFDQAQKDLDAEFLIALDAAQPGDVLFGIEVGEMKVAQRTDSWVVLSQDALPFRSIWHDGPSDEAVFVERYQREGDGPWMRTFHGWADSLTRQLVQAG